MDGVFGFTYCGSDGVGMGIFRVDGSQLIGVDFSGSRYRGTVVENPATGQLDLLFEMTVPAGVFLVQGTSAQEIDYIKSEQVTVPAHFGDGEPFKVHFRPGDVTLMVKRISDEFAAYADGITIDIRPLR